MNRREGLVAGTSKAISGAWRYPGTGMPTVGDQVAFMAVDAGEIATQFIGQESVAGPMGGVAKFAVLPRCRAMSSSNFLTCPSIR